MRTNKLSFRAAREIPIVEYLHELGHEPTHTRGHDHWYYSPLRNERTPSLKVNAKMNVWYDHGMGAGGSILDLGAKLHECTREEFLEELSAGRGTSISFHRTPPAPLLPETKIEILTIHELSSPELLQYLGSRAIEASTAQQYCKEVEFSA